MQPKLLLIHWRETTPHTHGAQIHIFWWEEMWSIFIGLIITCMIFFLGKLLRKIILKRSKICDINKYRGVCIITNNSPWNVSPSHFLSFQHFLFYRDLGSLISLKEKVLVHHRLHGLFLLLRRSHLNRTRNLYFNFNSIRPFVSHNLLRFFRLVAFA